MRNDFTSFNRSVFGFTLAELLIALAILGVIAAFTIPKVLQSQQDGRYKAIAQESVASVSDAFQRYKQANTVTSATSITDLLPYLNYVKMETGGLQVDNNYWSSGAQACDGVSWSCLRLHNGAILIYDGSIFNGTATTNMFYFSVDPDGKLTQSGSPVQGQGKVADFFLYYNGRVTTYGDCIAGTTSGNWTPTCPNSDPGPDPDWFKWGS
jgi:prepilin-type N-terminal cleavage/methylation domain-containing protein